MTCKCKKEEEACPCSTRLKLLQEITDMVVLSGNASHMSDDFQSDLKDAGVLIRSTVVILDAEHWPRAVRITKHPKWKRTALIEIGKVRDLDEPSGFEESDDMGHELCLSEMDFDTVINALTNLKEEFKSD